MKSYGNPKRTRADKAAALCSMLVMARAERVREMVADHTAETFAQAHGIPVTMVRETFERARQAVS